MAFLVEPKNFSIEEFRCHCGSCKLLLRLEILARCQTLRDSFGHSIRVNTGHRCKKHNGAIGGSPRSQHLGGAAADLSCSDFRFPDLVVIAMAMDFAGFGIYLSPKSGGFMHVDDRVGAHVRWAQINGEFVEFQNVLDELGIAK